MGSDEPVSPDVLPNTQEVDDSALSQDSICESQSARQWGRLFSLKSDRCQLPDLDLTLPSYTFGRDKRCSLVASAANMTKKYLDTISKVHFRVYRESSSSGVFTHVHDVSSNGTFINGELLGRGKTRVLENNAEISLSTKNFRVFVFHDSGDSESSQYPTELRRLYVITRLLGRGACGEVRLAFKKGTSERYAVKIVQRSRPVLRERAVTAAAAVNDKNNNLKSAANEAEVVLSLDHPCIVRVHEVVQCEGAVCLVQQLVEGGELLARVQTAGQLDESTAKLYFYQMLRAVQYLHRRGVAHRDLKPENVLLWSDEKHTLIKLADFGLAKLVTTRDKCADDTSMCYYDSGGTCLRTVCGTPAYVAPEILQRRSHCTQTSANSTGSYTHKVDCWSLGVILFICLGGYPPFSSERTDLPLLEQICRGRYTFSERRWGGVSAPALDLTRQLLTVDVQRRIGVDDALQHAWMQDDVVVKLAERLMKQAGCHGNNCETTRASKKLRLH